MGDILTALQLGAKDYPTAAISSANYVFRTLSTI